MADALESETIVLNEDDCWALLMRAEVGRLAICVGDGPQIFPVNFVVDNRTLLFRTAEGTKLAAVAVSPQVAFEVDGFDKSTGEVWSVVVHGTARLLEHLNEVYAAQELPLFSWNPTPKPVFVRVERTRVSGRRFLAMRGPHES